MGIVRTSSTLPGGVTPICTDCGIALCWDVDDATYTREQAFWDAWRCATCDPHARGSRQRFLATTHEGLHATH